MSKLQFLRNFLVILAIIVLYSPGCKSVDPVTQGDNFLSSGDTFEAARCYIKALKQGFDKKILADRMKKIAIIEKKDKLHIKSAIKLMNHGDYLNGKNELNKALEIDKNNIDTKILMAKACTKLSRFDESKIILDELISESVETPEIYFMLSKYYYDRGNYLETRKYLEKSLRMDKKNFEAKKFLTTIRSEMAVLKTTRKEESIEYFHRGIRSLYAGNHKKAIESFIISLSDSPPENNGDMNKLSRAGDVIMENYSLFSIYSNLVLSFLNLNKHEEALAYLVAINDIDEPSPWIYFKMGKIYESRSYWKQAHNKFKKAKYLNDKIPGLKSSLGFVYKKMGRYNDSITEFKNAVDEDPSNPVLRYNLGIMYKKIQQMKQAKTQLTKVKDLIKPGSKFYYTVEEHLANLPQ